MGLGGGLESWNLVGLFVGFVEEGEDFGNDGVDFEGDFGVEFGFLEDFDEVGIAMEGDIVGFGDFDDFFGDRALAFSREFGGAGFIVLEGCGFGSWGWFGEECWHGACIRY